MNTKLTLSIEEDVIEQAKTYAKKQGRSLSNLVEQFLMSLNQSIKKEKKDTLEISSFVKSMQGQFKVPKDFDYKKERADHLLKKYLDLDEQ
jgi:hypothetical protein